MTSATTKASTNANGPRLRWTIQVIAASMLWIISSDERWYFAVPLVVVGWAIVLRATGAEMDLWFRKGIVAGHTMTLEQQAMDAQPQGKHIRSVDVNVESIDLELFESFVISQRAAAPWQ